MIEFDASFIANFIAFTIPYLVCVISPGPDFALVVRNSVMYSRRTGIFTALGTSIGLTFHATYTLIGIALIIAKSEYGFLVIKILGAIYLGYLGITSILKRSAILEEMAEIEQAAKEKATKDLTAFQAIRIGFLTDALNPFAMVFFLSVFALVLDPTTSMPIKLFYGAEIWVVGFLWFAGVAWFFSQHNIRQLFARMGMWFGRLTGSVLVYFGLRLALAANP